MKGKCINVKIAGKGCDKYFELLHMVQDILSTRGEGGAVQEVNDSKSIAQLGVVQMPALVVDGEIVVQGTDFQKSTLMKALG